MAFGNFLIRSKSDLIELISEYGFLPFFENSIEGFSIEEHITPDCWWHSDTGEWSAWKWKGPVIRETGCAYGKFFEKKACYISPEWFLDFANYRRDGYDFDARFDDGLAAYRDKRLYDLVADNAPIISKKLKELGNYKKGGEKGFDTVMNRLQAQCYVTISDFVYMKNKRGEPYGWGVAEYSTPETFMGSGFKSKVYGRTPRESYERILSHFCELFPNTDIKHIKKFIR
ncbi:MAG: hypothetical protein IJT79_10065 [Ruminococcus sp.]|nr:hypothetical protein [Ruminococcus sp.]